MKQPIEVIIDGKLIEKVRPKIRKQHSRVSQKAGARALLKRKAGLVVWQF